MGRPASGKWRAEPRSEPDSGHPTVRDRRGALGDVTHGEPRNPTRKSKERLWSLLAYRCARPGSIPTTRMSGSVGGWGQQRPWSTRPPVRSMATRSGTFARIRLRAAVRRQSWRKRVGTPAAWQALRQAVRQRRTGMPSRWKTSWLSGSRRARRRARDSAMGGEMGVGARMRAGLRASTRRARHLPMRYETGLPSSVIRFRT